MVDFLTRDMFTILMALWATPTLFAQSASKRNSKGLSELSERSRSSEANSGATVLDTGSGRYAFSFSVPDGGNPQGGGLVGARYYFAPERAFGLYLQFANDTEAQTSSNALYLRYMSVFAQKERVNLHSFFQASMNKNGGEANKGKDDAQYGIGLGIGVEFALVKDFTLSAELGLNYSTLQNSKSTYYTSSSRLAVNFYY